MSGADRGAAGSLRFDCLVTGVGGQGTVLLSRLIGEAALIKGLDVRGSETIGMAQRGGSVVSHLRIGAGISSPLIPPGKADLIIAFERAEALRTLPFLSPAGQVLTLDRALPAAGSPPPAGGAYDAEGILARLTSALAGRLTVISWEEILRRCGSPRVSNVALLGAAAAKKLLPFSLEELTEAVQRRVPAPYLEMNLRALRAGMRPYVSGGGP